MEVTDFVTAQAATSYSDLPHTVSVSHLTGSAINATSSFFSNTSAKDLALIPFRFLMRVDDVLFRRVPEVILRSVGLQEAANRASLAVSGYWNGPGTGVADTAAAAMAANAGQAVAGQGVGDTAATTWSALFTEGFQTSTFKSYWGMMHYLASRWAITCFLMALILNRVNVYGRSRQRIYLTWSKRLALRLIPIMLFFTQIRQLMQAIRCQTSPDYSLYRHGDNDKYSLLDWSTDGGIVHTLASTMLWWGNDEAACAAVGMSRPGPGVRAPSGSFALLWPTFLRLSLSHFVDNLSAALQQIPVMTEVGMSVFEHSLAFAEAETMITQALSTAASTSSAVSNHTASTTNLTQAGTIPASGTLLALSDAAASLFGPHVLDRVNVPVEVLIVALLSSCNAFAAHIINVMGKQHRLRLINTGFWGCSFMAAFIWGFFTTSAMVRSGDNGDNRPVTGLLHFPTVAIVGFLPHMTILLGIWICVCIYAIALLLTAVSLGTNSNIRQPSRLSERISIAHDNLQAALQVKTISVRWSEDFYTALLRAGFAALTAASEAVFLNEGRSVEMRQFTWLEEERIDELELSRSMSPDEGQFQIAENVGLPPSNPGTDDRGRIWESGYAKERKFDDKNNKDGELQPNGTFIYPNPRTDGVGALQRTTRFYLLFIFMRGILFTIAGWAAYGIGAFLDRIGITSRPRWLRRFVGKSLKRMEDKQRKARGYGGMKTLDFWLIGGDGKLALPKSDDTDIEQEMRKRVVIDHEENVDQVLDEKMYDWWKMGGWFGTKDISGDYAPQSQDDDEDLTSVITESVASASEVGDENDWESESEGRRTPTQLTTTQTWSFSSVGRDRSSSPDVINDTPLDAATLARFLNPPDQQSRMEARILASHLTSEISGARIMTRSRYRQELESERSRVLLAGKTPLHPIAALVTSDTDKPRPLTPTEEAEVLEDLLITRRKAKAAQSPSMQVRPPGVEDDDDNKRQPGPPCVVCQSEPRTIIAWPCRCLCLCEDCRVTLAMNNFGNCVTCRRNVGGFVRLYVP